MVFSYYGSKSKIITLYPEPKHEKIIEPFAGSARYAVRYYSRDVWINDKYPVIYRIWKWIQQASRKDIDSLPEVKPGKRLSDYKQLSDVERELLGFAVQEGVNSPRNELGKLDGIKTSFQRLKTRLRFIAGRINHWKITCLDYRDIPNQKATWFIDPPYQTGGEIYIVNSVNYRKLAVWCNNRKGQVIVCEGRGANWLPFKPIATCSRGPGQFKSKDRKQKNETYQEQVWIKGVHPYRPMPEPPKPKPKRIKGQSLL